MKLPIETTVSTLGNAPIMEVSLESEQEKEKQFQGLKTKVTTFDTASKRPGYTIYQKRCKHCGSTSDEENDSPKKTRCASCGNNDWGIIQKSVNPDQTEKIINTKLQYQCNKCGASYDRPTKCCLANYELTTDDIGKFYRGFMCLGCGKTYIEKVACCSNASMVSGRFMPARPELRPMLGL